MSSEGVDVSNQAATGRVLDHGAQVISWRPHGTAEVIWLSAQAIDQPGSAIRGGVPVCFPWFGSGRSGNLSPSHGFARTADWTRMGIVEDETVTTVVHRLTSNQASGADFPFAYTAHATAMLGERLAVSIEVVNAGAVDFMFEIALHAYFSVGDVTHVRVEGLDGCRYHDKVRDEVAVQAGDVVVTGEVDRVYRSSGPVTLVDPALGRSLRITKEGSASTVVWNPWIDRAHALVDFGDDEWRSMLCIETACIGEDAVALAPGEAHTIGMTVCVLDS